MMDTRRSYFRLHPKRIVFAIFRRVMAGEKDLELRPGAISAFGRETIAGLHCFG